MYKKGQDISIHPLFFKEGWTFVLLFMEYVYQNGAKGGGAKYVGPSRVGHEHMQTSRWAAI